jgi:tRNA threonylcarbamoyl adenosine modification protein YjeE
MAGDRIFLRGDLGSGKSTFVRALLRHHLKDSALVVRSPTYTYYQKYEHNIYHFDLYRIESLDDLLLT